MLFSCTLNVQLTVEHKQVRFNNECVSNLFQAPEGVPAFQFYTTFQWELRRRVLRLFQQAAHKVQSSIYCKVSEVHEQVHTSMSICSMHRSHTHPSGEGCYTSACPFCLAMCSSNVSSLQYSQFSCVRCVTVKVKKCSIEFWPRELSIKTIAKDTKCVSMGIHTFDTLYYSVYYMFLYNL